jgi:hypothetical protein
MRSAATADRVISPVPATHETRKFERLEWAALLVFGDLRVGIGSYGPNGDGNELLPCPFRGTQPHGAEVNAMAA